MRLRPHVLTQLGFGHQAAGMLDQIAQHRQGPGTQGRHLCSPPHATMRRIQTEWPKGEVVFLFHGVSCRLRLNSL